MPTLTRNLAKEQDALRALLESPEKGGAFTGVPGTDITKASPATQQLIQEQINMRVYGTATPQFDTVSKEEARAGFVDQGDGPATTGARPEITDETGDETISRPEVDTETPAETYYDTYGEDLVAPEQPRTLEDIRQEQIDRAQTLINATEEMFLQDISYLTEQGVAAMGRTRALTVAAGTTTSPFGAARKAETAEDTAQIIETRKRERSAEIASLIAQAENRSDELYQAELQHYQEERAFYVSERDKAELKQQAEIQVARESVASIIGSAAANGDSFSELGSDPDFQKIFEKSGMTEFEARHLFQSSTPEATATYTSQGGNIVQYYFDPRTQEMKVNTIPIPGLQEDTTIKFDSRTVQGKDGQSYIVFSPKNAGSAEELLANTIIQPVGGQAVKTGSKGTISTDEEDILTKDQFTDLAISGGVNLGAGFGSPTPELIDQLYGEYLSAVGAVTGPGGEGMTAEQLIDTYGLTTTDKQKMFSQGLSVSSAADVQKYLQQKFSEEEKTTTTTEDYSFLD